MSSFSPVAIIDSMLFLFVSLVRSITIIGQFDPDVAIRGKLRRVGSFAL